MKKNAAILAPLLALSLAAAGAAAPAPQDGLTAKVDALLNKTYKAGEPGAALLIKKDGRVLHRKGFGTADLELDIPVDPGMSFRLGSITKQFTAVAILMLEERGQLSVKDPLNKYLPDFPMQGQTITLEHLLTHTSGVVSYTSLPEWLPLWRKDMSVAELIGLFKDKPLEFAPGEHWKYSNSGYVLLGAVIEKAAGQTYESFIQKNIFEPLRMTHSYYGSASRILPGRIPGYASDGRTFVNAPYISMSQPYAAGSLLSTVDDLALWWEGLLAGKLIKRESLERAWTPFKLNDGSNTGYGYGWSISDYRGHRLVEHGGGIMGFSTYGMIFPAERIFIAILTNSAIAGRDPEPLAVQVADMVLGLTPPEIKPVALAEADLAPLAGVYADWEKNEMTVTREGSALSALMPGGSKRALLPLGPLEFAVQDRPVRLVFERKSGSPAAAVTLVARNGVGTRFERTAKTAPAERRVVAVDPKILGRYAGEYALAPTFSIVVTLENGRLMAQATGQPKFEIFPESETRFFLKVVDAQIEFQIDGEGKTTGLVLTQGGRKMPAKKTK